MMCKTVRLLFGAAVFAALLVNTLWAQSFTATLLGSVIDASGAAIPNATIVATNAATNAKVEARSDGMGRYVVASLQPGVYSLEVTSTGFKKFVQPKIELAVGQQAKIDVSMTVGEVTENVTVEAAVSTIETATSTVGKVVSNRAILNLPLNSRNIYSLIYLTPGVAGSIGNNYNSMSYSINGARASMMDTLIDGATASHPTVQGYSGISAFPSVDAIGEFKVLGANFPAEYGRTAGSVLNVVYKSGTNSFHGTAYEFLRNSQLDANNFYNNLRGVPLSSFKRSQYGGTFGGPVIKDRTFFMSSYEGLRQRSFSSRTATVPTALERAGDFTQTFAGANNPVLIYDPFTTRASGTGFIRDAFPGNIVPAGRQDRVGQNIAKYFPAPNTQGVAWTNANNYYSQGSSSLDIDQIDGRVDHNFTSTQRLFVRYSYRNQDSLPAVLWPVELTAAETTNNERNRMHNGVVDYSLTPNATTVVSLRGGYARSLYFYENLGLGFQASSLGFPAALDTAGGLAMFPRTTASGYTTLGNTDNRYNAFVTYTMAGSVSKLMGAHSIKAGYDGRLIRVNNRESRSTSGDFAFTAGMTQGPNPNTAAANRGNSIASLLLGTGNSGSLIQSFKDAAAQSWYTAVYVQDDWRVTKTLHPEPRPPLRPRHAAHRALRPHELLRSLRPLAAGRRGPRLFEPHRRAHVSSAWTDVRDRSTSRTPTTSPRASASPTRLRRTPPFAAVGATSTPSRCSRRTAPSARSASARRRPGSTPSTASRPTTCFRTRSLPASQVPPGSSQGLLTQVGANIQAPVQETLTPYSMQWNFNVQQNLPGRDPARSRLRRHARLAVVAQRRGRTQPQPARSRSTWRSARS